MTVIIVSVVLLLAGMAATGVVPEAQPATSNGIIGLIWLILFLVVGTKIVQAISEVRDNMKQPLLSFPARVVSKRFDVSGGWDVGAGWNGRPPRARYNANTTYYITFELEDGERWEYGVSGHEYGMLAEGDRGTLSRQGTWYKGFSRQRESAEK